MYTSTPVEPSNQILLFVSNKMKNIPAYAHTLKGFRKRKQSKGQLDALSSAIFKNKYFERRSCYMNIFTLFVASIEDEIFSE